MTLSNASQLRKNQEFQQAIAIYTQLWQQNPLQFNEWDGWSYAFCLSKLSRHQGALNICRQLFPRFTGSEILNSLYAKSIYHTQFSKEPMPSIATLSKAAQAMYELSPPHAAYSLTSRAIFRLIKVLQNQTVINWQEIETWLLKMDPDLLDNRAFQMTDAHGKMRELASPLEEWYAQMIKTKAGLNNPEGLLEVLSVARSKGLRWHYNNDIWFARKEAFAYRQLGETEKACSILRRLLQRKRDWFLFFDLAQTVTDKSEALKLLAEAALAPGKNEMKLRLFETLFQQLKDHPEYNREAALHLNLVASLREENGWPVNAEIITEIRMCGIDPSRQGSSVALVKALMPFWKKLAAVVEPTLMEGIVTQILPNARSGFIKCGKDSYFASFKNAKGEVQLGSKVSFTLQDSFDKKKNRASQMAVNVRLIKPVIC